MNEMILQATLSQQEAMRNEAIKEYKLRTLRFSRRPDMKRLVLNLSVVVLLIVWSIV